MLDFVNLFMITNEQLDHIFLFIQERGSNMMQLNFQYIWSLYVEKTPELGINITLLQDILHKLIQDGYIREKDGIYRLTTEGRNFKGYSRASKWWRKISRKNILEGVIYSLIVIFIIWVINKLRA